MGFKKKYRDEITEIISQMYPEYSKEDISESVTSIMKEQLRDPSIIIDNNVTKWNERTTLTGLYNWMDTRVPVVSGNATFFKQPTELKSPTSEMLRSLKKGRKAVKKQMFGLNPNSDEYAQLDLDQQNKKVIMNADYGGSGAPTAAFYTKYSPAATTLMAQSLITTMAMFFEGLIGDRLYWWNINECFDWMHQIKNKKTEKIDKWIKIPTSQDLINRIIRHMIALDPNDYEYIKRYIENCTDSERVYMYYANNYRDLISFHPNIKQLFYSIMQKLPNYEAATELPDQYKDKFENVDAYNKWVVSEMFLNPYEPPESVSKEMKEITEIFEKYIYSEYITPDSIMKLNNHKRNTVLLVDTDSNIINANLFASFVLYEVFDGESFGRKSMYNEMIMVNVCCSFTSVFVAKMLDYYGRCHNMDPEARAELVMKNEFLFRVLFLMLTKKRYGASIVLREGNINIPFKAEIKGLDFIKAGVTDETQQRFTKIFKDNILFSDKVDPHGLMKDLKIFEKEIYEDLRHGGTKYFRPQSYKSETAYKNTVDKNGVVKNGAWTQQVYRGSVIWNIFYPLDKIYALDRVKIIKTTITSPSDLEIIKDRYPEEYNTALTKVFMSDDINIRNSGMKVICIPATLEKTPEWIIPFINYDVTISDIMSSFKSVTESLRIEMMAFQTPNGKANKMTALVSL